MPVWGWAIAAGGIGAGLVWLGQWTERRQREHIQDLIEHWAQLLRINEELDTLEKMANYSVKEGPQDAESDHRNPDD